MQVKLDTTPGSGKAKAILVRMAPDDAEKVKEAAGNLPVATFIRLAIESAVASQQDRAAA